VDCLREACRVSGVPYHVGLAHSKDSFYGEMQPERMPIADNLHQRWEAWVRGGVLCSEMEAAALFVIASVLGKRAGGIMLALGGEDAEVGYAERITRLSQVAVEGVRQLIRHDQAHSQ
jgi:uridine phosphorylase